MYRYVGVCIIILPRTAKCFALPTLNPNRSRLRHTIRNLYHPSKKRVKAPHVLHTFRPKIFTQEKRPSSFFLPGEKSHMYRHMDTHMERHMVCHMESHMDSHMENENENENEIENDNENPM